MSRSVLVIEDSPDIADLVKLHLTDLGCRVRTAPDGELGLALACSESTDLIILDVMLPGMDGVEICRRLRQSAIFTPILMLTSRSSEADRVLGLESGADDYLVKPFGIPELVARVKAIFRRQEQFGRGETDTGELIRIGGLRIDCQRRSVAVDGRAVELTPKEFDLLVHFANHPGRVYSRAQLLDLVWGSGNAAYEHNVNSHINRLRAKIEPDPAEPRYIQTVWGVGYRFGEAPGG